MKNDRIILIKSISRGGIGQGGKYREIPPGKYRPGISRTTLLAGTSVSQWTSSVSKCQLCQIVDWRLHPYFIWLRGASRINRYMSSWGQLWMISTGCAKTFVWVCGDKQCRKVLLVKEPVAWRAWHGRFTIPAWTKGGPLSAGSARPAKSQYHLWLWHTQCQWNNYPEWDCAARSLWSGSTLRF